ncbi:MAG TPA: peptide chain release factor 3 [Negativicutes bacterium]|mgnify:FL=1|nr:peptide chain release factor 3 [Negativicutes bacterium]
MTSPCEIIEANIPERRTFAIISHPDAGKTTLTEKLLLYGGAIRLAGSVKARKSNKYAVSDWMEIERQRGISVTSSVMQFDYAGHRINILDTPGHQDFSEDTYRTLVAADSAVMLIDAGKGVEEQTRKLFHVCRMRGIPIFTFINKLDRYGKDPFALVEEIEQVLGIQAYPMNWPIGMGRDFRGVYNRELQQVEVFASGHPDQSVVPSVTGHITDIRFQELLGAHAHRQICDEIELLDMAGNQFDLPAIQQGELTPVFFGSAMTNFGVRPFLERFLELAPPPAVRRTSKGTVTPRDKNFSGFIFKIQANMNPAHRDRIAFVRICSGKFERGMKVNHVQSGKSIRLAQPQQFLAQERTIVEEAYPGDIIGISDPGIFRIGDTLSGDATQFKFEGIPSFPPEHFARVQTPDAMKRKQFIKGIHQLCEEGAVQLFKQPNIGIEAPIVGAVGALQFEVLEYRLKNEYGVNVEILKLPYQMARWVADKNFDYRRLTTMGTMFVMDEDDQPVILFEESWALRSVEKLFPELALLEISPAYSQEGNKPA